MGSSVQQIDLFDGMTNSKCIKLHRSSSEAVNVSKDLGKVYLKRLVNKIIVLQLVIHGDLEIIHGDLKNHHE